MNAPDRKWSDFFKILFGFFLGLALILLARGLGLYDVQEEHSFGLKEVINTLKDVFVLWAGWAFRGTLGKDEE